VRRIVEADGVAYADPAPFCPDRPLGEALLTPTRIYVKSCLAAARTGKVKAFAHITGGGLIENVPRILPEGLAARFAAAAWPLPPGFAWLMRTGGVPAEEMARTFNCGIGMVAIVDPAEADAIARILEAAGERVTRIGRIVERRDGMAGATIAGMAEAWPG
jgi:phosphoribosylformylglycinamidine cyclo-ligase